jgi:7-cyano-7-deazaguanine synthase
VERAVKKRAVVIHSGGMDSSICLALAVRQFGAAEVLSMSFRYGQRHSSELQRAAVISAEWGVDHTVVAIDCLAEITENALTRHTMAVEHQAGAAPSTLVVGRNGLMARLGAIHAHHLGASCIYMGVIEVESSNSGYRDCSRHYMDLEQEVLRLDLDDPRFEIRTPLVSMDKKETLEEAWRLGVLEYLLVRTITCYHGIPLEGCRTCPACLLRNEGLARFAEAHPEVTLPYGCGQV